jgi:hypothetical protein
MIRQKLIALTVALIFVACATGSVEKTRAHFEECKEQSGYKTATLTEVNSDGSFLYTGDDPEANKVLKDCLSRKGHPMSTTQQAKVEKAFYECARDVGARGASITSVAPDGAFKWRVDGGGEVSIAQQKTLMACMRAKGFRFYDGPGAAK